MSKHSIMVLDGDQQIPFLRGMVAYSLVERGLNFEQAYHVAQVVRDRIREKGVVTRKDLRRIINEVLKKEYGENFMPRSQLAARQVPMITVRGGELEPFSKGILSKSLQASGLEPQTAYAVAQEIEQSLLGAGQLEITRDQLRRLIYRSILDNHDSEFAERYLLWRYFKSPDKPVIVFFGGTAGVGKSSVANEIAYRLGVGKIVSTDTIREIMRMMLSRDLLPAIHRSSFEAWKEVPLDTKKPDVVVTAFREQAIRVLVGVRAMMRRAIEENTSVIIDGVHLVPGLMDFADFEDSAYLVPVVISTLSKSGYVKRFKARQAESGHRTARRYLENLASILQIQDYILEMAENTGTPIIENRNWDQTVASILAVITHTLREKIPVGREELLSRAL